MQHVDTWLGAVRQAVGLPSIEEQIELALDTQKRRAAGGQVGMFDMYSKSAQRMDQEIAARANKEASAKEAPANGMVAKAQSMVNTFRQDPKPPPAQVIPPGKPAQAPSLNLSVAARYRNKKGRG